ncbi:MAG: thioredoxin family protein [Bacteroidales bacterium]|nr:thioredoxin family protein [Bacteroidales bacterium]
MIRCLTSFLLVLFLGCNLFAQTKDSEGVYAVLDSLVINYVGAIQQESVETKEGECDFLINSVKDSLLRQHLALSLFNYYKEAPVMGDEAVAINIYDKWFANGTLKFRGEFEALDAEMFCNLNRNTLLGMDAPKIKARKPYFGKIIVPLNGVTTVLWFYDTSCSKCKAESKLLPEFLEKNVDFPLQFVAFYAGQNRKSWRQFRRSFKVGNPDVKLVHCWDPKVDSDYLRLYGVISTPKMYMIAPEGSIIGRRLELDALQQLLPVAREINTMFDGNDKNNN